MTIFGYVLVYTLLYT